MERTEESVCKRCFCRPSKNGSDRSATGKQTSRPPSSMNPRTPAGGRFSAKWAGWLQWRRLQALSCCNRYWWKDSAADKSTVATLRTSRQGMQQL